jgi:hypothetical protein
VRGGLKRKKGGLRRAQRHRSQRGAGEGGGGGAPGARIGGAGGSGRGRTTRLLRTKRVAHETRPPGVSATRGSGGASSSRARSAGARGRGGAGASTGGAAAAGLRGVLGKGEHGPRGVEHARGLFRRARQLRAPRRRDALSACRRLPFNGPAADSNARVPGTGAGARAEIEDARGLRTSDSYGVGDSACPISTGWGRGVSS